MSKNYICPHCKKRATKKNKNCCGICEKELLPTKG
jgi:hypothetical protein